MGLMFRAEAARNSPAFSAIYMPGGKPVPAGTTLRFRDLARTLRKLAADGHDGFYRGSVARRLVAGVQGGRWYLDPRLIWLPTR
jgi:gamma-glutamyltranspeptidase/glutathione hydrolase